MSSFFNKDPIFHIDAFDINNDGNVENVYRYYPCTRYACADIYFVIKDGDSFIDEHWPDVTQEMLLSHSKYVYPCSWLTNSNKFEMCEPFSTREISKKDRISEFPINNYRSSNESYYYIIRYLYLEPFHFKGSTYFLAWTEAWALRNVCTVLKPLPNGKVKEACIFLRPFDQEKSDAND